MKTAAYIKNLEACTLSPGDFDHEAHVRAARWYLRELGLQAGSERFASSVRSFAKNAGAPGKFHATVTRALLRIIAARMREGEDWQQFRLRNTDLLDSATDLLARHYSASLLSSDSARAAFVPPDREALP